jgi:uncharacterized integral membrane protein
MMKLIVRLIALAIFIVFFDFSLKNTDEVVLHLFWNAQAKTPLILLLLGFLALGLVLGVLAMMGPLLRYRAELHHYRKESSEQKKAAAEIAEARANAPGADSLIDQVGH